MVSQFHDLAVNREADLLRDLSELIRIPSVSPDVTHQSDCAHCAGLLAERLRSMGLTTQLVPTSGNPLVFAEHFVGLEAPTLVFYGHYDVQLPGDHAKWCTGNAFDPQIIGDRLYGRGAQDNKGQSSYVLGAIQALKEEGLLKCNLKVLLEGEEETSSTGLEEKLPEMGELLRGDILLVCDTDAPSLGRAGITLALRGAAFAVITIEGPERALHSGMFGGMGQNPINALGKIIGSLHNDDGSIAVKGFMDKVRDVAPEDAARIIASSPTDAELQEQTGWSALHGEPKYPPQVRATLRPTMDLTMIASGEMGQNAIPSSATARIAARLVPDQEPAESLEQILAHVREHTPPGVRLKIGSTETGPWIYLGADTPTVKSAQEAAHSATGSEGALIYAGGSIPIVAALQRASGADPLLLGFGLPEDRIHEENESFHLQQLRAGFATVCELLTRL